MSADMIQTLGSALLHFSWQGAVLAVLLLAALSTTRNARVRYSLGVLTLALMAICPLVTFVFLERPFLAQVPGGINLDSTVVSPAISNITVALNTAAPVSTFDALTCLVCIWSAGVCLFGVRAFGGWLVLQKLRRTAQECISPALLARCRRLQKRIGVKAFVRYAYSEMVDAPAVLGWFRPVVLIPLSAVAGLSTEQLEAILAHELAHIRRYDALVNLFQIAIETTLFYHPAVWWVNRVIRVERENCCDDLAVSICGNASEYARALAAMSGARPSWVLAANGGALKARVSRLLGMQKIAHGIPRTGLAALALLCASCIGVAAGLFKQDPPAPPPPPPSQPSIVAPSAPSQPSVRSAPVARAPRPAVPPVPAVSPLPKAQPLDDATPLAEIAPVAQEPPAAPEARVPEHSGSSYIDSLQAAGLTKLTVDDIITLKIQGVTADYIRQIKAAGFDPSVREIIEMKIQGVSPDYIRDIRATGLKPTVRELVEMKIQGVTPAFIHAMQSAGFAGLPIRDYVSARIQGVTPEFIEKVRSHGFKDLTFRQLIGLKMADVF